MDVKTVRPELLVRPTQRSAATTQRDFSLYKEGPISSEPQINQIEKILFGQKKKKKD